MTTEEKFHAAVNVIRSLPKNGSYQPSHDLMLRFYAYFKQATQGPVSGSRPAFWDIVGRAKYDAWKKLGDMSKQAAMAKYVDELHTIVETMSYSDKVASFLDAPSSELDNLKLEDLQLVIGDVIERVRSQPNSPLASREASPNRLISSLSTSSGSTSHSPSRAVDNEESDHSDAEYVDTIDTIEPRKHIPNGIPPDMTNGYIGHKSRPRSRTLSVDISQEIANAVSSIKMDIDRLTEKVAAVEKHNRSSSSGGSRAMMRRTKWPFGISFKLLTFIVLWPFVANLVMRRYSSRR
ncbi:acyl-CoA-binding domain-containing protein 5 [Atheta coriaria]|uniref:acyl-CoA-binding domain-containing protein 5 n=1 Tax=Dalotia coriaria TaxID=877792 RepID=UPI0031F47625